MNTHAEAAIQRAVTLQLLSPDRETWTVPELVAGLSDLPELAVRHGLGELELSGVAVLVGEHVRAASCVRRLDSLDLIEVAR